MYDEAMSIRNPQRVPMPPHPMVMALLFSLSPAASSSASWNHWKPFSVKSSLTLNFLKPCSSCANAGVTAIIKMAVNAEIIELFFINYPNCEGKNTN